MDPIVVNPAGVRCLYDECIDLATLATPVIKRGSHVERIHCWPLGADLIVIHRRKQPNAL